MNLNDFRIFVAAKALREAAERIAELERQNASLRESLRDSYNARHSLAHENAALRKTNARYMTKLDQFHTGYAVPKALGSQTPNEFVRENALSYNKLAELHETQRKTIAGLQGDSRKLSQIWRTIHA
jgi:uncharacterized protein (UPF0335 family)